MGKTSSGEYLGNLMEFQREPVFLSANRYPTISSVLLIDLTFGTFRERTAPTSALYQQDPGETTGILES